MESEVRVSGHPLYVDVWELCAGSVSRDTRVAHVTPLMVVAAGANGRVEEGDQSRHVGLSDPNERWSDWSVCHSLDDRAPYYSLLRFRWKFAIVLGRPKGGGYEYDEYDFVAPFIDYELKRNDLTGLVVPVTLCVRGLRASVGSYIPGP